LPGNGIFRAETKRPKRLGRFKGPVAETKVSLNNPANSGLVSENQEISVSGRVGLRGLEPRAKHAVAIEPVSRE
jgi:hypothetical protein